MSAWLPVFAALAAAVVSAVVLWPLRRQGRAGFITAVITLAVAGGCLYLLVGEPRAAQQQAGPSVANLREGVQALQQALQRDPQRADGWALLGRSQTGLGDTAAAAEAFARAVALAPDEPDLLVEAAQARAQADPRKQFDDTALGWLQQARRVQPNAERAGWLLGIALRQRGRDEEAVQVWNSLLPQLEPGAAAALQAQIQIARQAAGQAPAEANGIAAASPARTPAADDTPLLRVRVQLPPAFKQADWPATAQVFVLARAVEGSPMPLAVRRVPLQDLPPSIDLGDGDSPMPTATLSSQQQVEVLARISRSGSANRGEGDLHSEPVRVALPHTDVIELQLR